LGGRGAAVVHGISRAPLENGIKSGWQETENQAPGKKQIIGPLKGQKGGAL